MHPRSILRLEGVAVFLAAVAGFMAIDGRLWLLLVLALAPDLSMLAYLAGTRYGSYGYNLAHTYVAPLALGAVGIWASVPLPTAGALVWAGHIGADRAIGYGLKHQSSFGHTHLRSKSDSASGEDPVGFDDVVAND